MVFLKNHLYSNLQQILDKAIEKKITYFDTAQSYGNSEKILSHISNNHNINIITKINCDDDIQSKITLEPL